MICNNVARSGTSRMDEYQTQILEVPLRATIKNVRTKKR